MQTVKLILNALVIGALNLASIVIGFWFISLGDVGEQRLVPSAAPLPTP